jgi:predicted benzoate:H+ symporter BenE
METHSLTSHILPSYYVVMCIQRGLYATRVTGLFINCNIVLIILPVCRSFNKLIHTFLSRLSPHLLATYLEKLKVVHQFLALMLIFLSCKSLLFLFFFILMALKKLGKFICSPVLHIVVNFLNAINFIKNYDSEHPELNWARGQNDVS